MKIFISGWTDRLPRVLLRDWKSIIELSGTQISF